ncbi:MAG: hypothetical protein G8345_13310 [Magnetococcales bacterium]|nr:hypothetical protein [Magnetococcales bacterium]NGZ27852.1 hypothetical protein [Magnetococcales bacterium]
MTGWRIIMVLALVGQSLWADSPLPTEQNTPASMDKLFTLLRQECAECRVLKMELEEEEHGAVYEVKLLTREGTVIKREYRASDLQLLRQKTGKHR